MTTTPGKSLQHLVASAADRVGGYQPLAEAIGITLSPLLRGAKKGRLATETLLAIAEVGGLDPTNLLRVAGKAETDARIRRLYGPRRAPLTKDQRQLLTLDAASQRQLCRLIDNLKP